MGFRGAIGPTATGDMMGAWVVMGGGDGEVVSKSGVGKDTDGCLEWVRKPGGPNVDEEGEKDRVKGGIQGDLEQ